MSVRLEAPSSVLVPAVFDPRAVLGREASLPPSLLARSPALMEVEELSVGERADL